MSIAVGLLVIGGFGAIGGIVGAMLSGEGVVPTVTHHG